MPELHTPTSIQQCPQNGHRFISVYVFWCAHEQRYVVWYGSGLAESPGDVVDIPYGPFDGMADVHDGIRELFSQTALLSLLRRD